MKLVFDEDNQLRLRTSLEQILDPDVDPSLLARTLGSSSHSHFTDCSTACSASRRRPSGVRAGERRDVRTIVEAPLAASS